MWEMYQIRKNILSQKLFGFFTKTSVEICLVSKCSYELMRSSGSKPRANIILILCFTYPAALKDYFSYLLISPLSPASLRDTKSLRQGSFLLTILSLILIFKKVFHFLQAANWLILQYCLKSVLGTGNAQML